MIKRTISLLLAFTMILTLSACGSQDSPNVAQEIEPVVIERESEPESLQAANKATSIALKQYIHARLATEVYSHWIHPN